MKENNEIVRGHINKVPKFWMQTQSIDWILQSVKGVNNVSHPEISNFRM
jgi:hypothetical protein